jgi:hypothetical protein
VKSGYLCKICYKTLFYFNEENAVNCKEVHKNDLVMYLRRTNNDYGDEVKILHENDVGFVKFKDILPV